MSRPACSGCGGTGRVLRYLGPDGRICPTCYRRSRTFTCPACGQARPVASATRVADRSPVECWDCRQDRNDHDRVQATVDRVRAVVGGLTEDAIRDSVMAAATSRVERKWLAEHLTAHPDALTSSDDIAPVTARLVEQLRRAGAARLRLAGCQECGTETVLVTVRADGRRVCPACRRALGAEPCGRCGTRRTVAVRESDGAPVCNPCRRADPDTWEPCHRCGRVRRVNARTADGQPVCPTCYQPPDDTCSGCGTAGPIAARTDSGPVCPSCYRHPRRPCGRCGKTRRIALRGRDGQPDLCGACHWAPTDVCVRCGDTARGFGATKDGHVCLACTAAERLDRLLTGPDGTVPAALAGLREAFLATEQPRSILTWLHKSPATTILRRLVTGDLALSHDALDGLEQTPSMRHLRHLLQATGALPDRHHGMADLQRAIDTQIATITVPRDALELKAYATWHVLARLRRRDSIAATATANAADRFRQAVRFVTWLHDQHRDLTGCRQADLDRWVADAPATRGVIGAFIGFTTRRGTTTDLTPPRPARQTGPAPTLSGDWSLARRLLHDDNVDAADRVVGALVLLYAQPVTRIAALTPADITDTDGQLHLRVGTDPLYIPPPLDNLLRELPWRRQTGPSSHTPSDADWLFPGRNAGRHQHPEYLRQRLRALDVPTRTSRNAALLRLAADVPAKIIADLLGLHITTATRWTRQAGGDWATYAAGRARVDPRQSSQPA